MAFPFLTWVNKINKKDRVDATHVNVLAKAINDGGVYTDAELAKINTIIGGGTGGGIQIINNSTPSSLTGLIKGNGTDIDIAVSGTDYASPTHVHGSITNAGKIGSTADLPVFTTTGGVITTKTITETNTLLGLNTVGKLASSTYTGTGTTSHVVTIPTGTKLVFVSGGGRETCLINPSTGANNFSFGGSSSGLTVTWSTSSVTISNGYSAGESLNTTSATYYVITLGS